MKSRHSARIAWVPSSPRGAAVFSTTWVVILSLLTAVSFISVSGIPPLLRSTMLFGPGPDCACAASKERKTPSSILPSSLSNDNASPVFAAPVQQLLDELRETRKLAEGDEKQSYSHEEADAWAKEHPCRSRAELPELYETRNVADAPPNPQWAAVFEEYSQLHRTCMRKVGNDLVAIFSESRSIPGCKFVTGWTEAGLGNKMMYAASVLLYAVITKRVVLFPAVQSPQVLCEPFQGSSWILPQSLEYLNHRVKGENRVNVIAYTNATKSFLAWVDVANGTVNEGLFHAEADDGWQPVNRFFCDTEQKFLSKVEWVSAAGRLYFLPKLHSIPSFRPILESLFPKPGLTLTYLVRSAFLPDDEAWDRVRRIYATHLENSDRRVSIQPRYRGGHLQWEEHSGQVNSHITKCLHENGILPEVVDYSDARKLDDRSLARSPVVKVMIASLFTDLYDHLNEIYLRHSTVNGESVGLVQVTHDGWQGSGREEDLEAIAEIICLSLSDVILGTPLSTFGGAAQVYGALTPYLIDFSDDEGASCKRSPSVDVCYQGDYERTILECPFDPSVDRRNVMDVSPYIHSCSGLEWGMLVISDDTKLSSIS